MKKELVAKLAEDCGVQADDIEFLKNHPNKFKKFRASIEKLKTSKPEFPKRSSNNLRAGSESSAKEYRNCPIRITKRKEEVSVLQGQPSTPMNG